LNISSANIPAVTLVISAIMRARAVKEIKSPVRGCRSLRSNAESMKGAVYSPSLIANHSQLEGRTLDLPLNGIT
jgi:hypothetical protein